MNPIQKNTKIFGFSSSLHYLCSRKRLEYGIKTGYLQYTDATEGAF